MHIPPLTLPPPITPPFTITLPPPFPPITPSLLPQRDVDKRLGCVGGGSEELKNHPFFAGVDWVQVGLCHLFDDLDGCSLLSLLFFVLCSLLALTGSRLKASLVR